MRASLVVCLGAFCVLACGVKPVPLELSKEWPSDPPSLEVATKTWTQTAQKRGALSEDVELLIDVDATYRSPQWRAALVEHLRAAGLSKAEAAAVREEQQKTAAVHHEFVLLVATHDRRINDLSKGERSSWRVRLRNSKGQEVAPTKIFKDRRPPAAISAELPHVGPFDEIYIAQFPAEFTILGDDAEKFTLHLSSTRASVELEWRRAK